MQRLLAIGVEDHFSFEWRNRDDHRVVFGADAGILNLPAIERRSFGDADLLEVEVERFSHRRQFEEISHGGSPRRLIPPGAADPDWGANFGPSRAEEVPVGSPSIC